MENVRFWLFRRRVFFFHDWSFIYYQIAFVKQKHQIIVLWFSIAFAREAHDPTYPNAEPSVPEGLTIVKEICSNLAQSHNKQIINLINCHSAQIDRKLIRLINPFRKGGEEAFGRLLHWNSILFALSINYPLVCYPRH